MIRKKTVLTGDIDAFDLFNPSLEWDTLPVGTWSYLGSHTCNCLGGSSVNEKNTSYIIYPNPVNIGSLVNIKATKSVKSVLLISTLGQKIFFRNNINTEKLAKGSYIVRIEFYDGSFAENKLIVE